MAKIPYLFKYSGSKRSILPYIRPLPSHKRIVEGYLGSGCFAVLNQGPAIGYEVNDDVIQMWKWLQSVTPQRLHDLETIRREAIEKHPNHKPDVRSLGLERGEETYVRINTSGVYCGQLSSWILYPQWKLPVKETSSLLDRVKEIEIVHGKVQELYTEQDGDLVFLDPPYRNTHANYKQQAKIGIEEGYQPQQTIDLIAKIKSPIILTYGTDAKEVFPNYEWTVVLKKKVPNIRRGGTVERTEHAAYINWPKE